MVGRAVALVAVFLGVALAQTGSFSAPTANSVWTRGQEYTVSWTSTATAVDVRFYYSTTNGPFFDVTVNDAATNSVTFTCPNVMENQFWNLRLYTTGAAINNYLATMNIRVVAAPASITLFSPVSSAIWYRGSTNPVNFTVNGTIEQVRIDWLYNSQVVRSVDNLTATDVYDFVVDESLPANLQTTQSNWRIRVTSSVFDGIHNEVSVTSGYFRVLPEPSTMAVLEPNSSATWLRGSTMPVIWNVTGSVDQVTIELLYNSRVVVTKTNVTSLYYYQQDNWEVDKNGTLMLSNNNWQFRVTSSVFSAKHDSASARSQYFRFAPVPSSITVISPRSGDVWARGEIYRISWETTGDITEVMVQLYINNNLIAESTTTDPNSKYINYNVPLREADYITSSNYRIRITSTVFDAAQDEQIANSGYFRIDATAPPTRSPVAPVAPGTPTLPPSRDPSTGPSTSSSSNSSGGGGLLVVYALIVIVMIAAAIIKFRAKLHENKLQKLKEKGLWSEAMVPALPPSFHDFTITDKIDMNEAKVELQRPSTNPNILYDGDRNTYMIQAI